MESSIASSSSATIYSFNRKPISQNLISSSFSVSFPFHEARLRAVKTGSDGGGVIGSSQERGADLSRKLVAPSPATNDEEESAAEKYSDDDGGEKKSGDGDTWVDWEDQILEDTVPLVGFVRMILHSGKLSPEHERTILERVLPYHPAYEDKIGSGVDYITISIGLLMWFLVLVNMVRAREEYTLRQLKIGYHSTFGSSRCLCIVRKDGELVDFSYCV